MDVRLAIGTNQPFCRELFQSHHTPPGGKDGQIVHRESAVTRAPEIRLVPPAMKPSVFPLLLAAIAKVFAAEIPQPKWGGIADSEKPCVCEENRVFF